MSSSGAGWRLHGLLAVLNQVVRARPSLQEQLKTYALHQVHIHWAGSLWTLHINPAGEWDVPCSEPPKAVTTLTWRAQGPRGRQPVFADYWDVQGEAQLAALLQECLQAVLQEPELSLLPSAPPWLQAGVRHLRRQLQQGLLQQSQGWARQLQDALVHEHAWLVTPAALHTWSSAVDALRDDTARLALRLQQLEQAKQNPHQDTGNEA